MRALLVRVGADQSEGGGNWNGPADLRSSEFTFVAIPEGRRLRPGHKKPFAALSTTLERFGVKLPANLRRRGMHLDPDFENLTYGDQGQRAKQILLKVGRDDLLVFYAGLRDVSPAPALVYALIGLYVVDEVLMAVDVPQERCHENAHTRRVLTADAQDIVVRARPGLSGRLAHCIPIGSYREQAYRVWPRLLKQWGGLTVKDGYLQRSARLPEFRDAERFYAWFNEQKVELVKRNN